MSEWLDPPEAAAWQHFVLGATHLISRLEAPLMAAGDLTHLDYGILARLSDAAEHRDRMSTLAHIFGVDASVITYRVNRMATRGLVERVRCPTDKRGVFAVLTPAGQAILDRLAPTHVEAVRREFIDLLSAEELEVIRTVFERIRAAQGTLALDLPTVEA